MATARVLDLHDYSERNDQYAFINVRDFCPLRYDYFQFGFETFIIPEHVLTFQ